MALADPELELAAEHIAGFFALVAVALFAVGAGREARVEHFQLAQRLRAEQLVGDAILVVQAGARIAPHHVAAVGLAGGRLAGEEPLDGHPQAAGDIEQRRDRGIGQVAFQLADVAGGELALLGQLAEGHALAFAQRADARAEELALGVGVRRWQAGAHGSLHRARDRGIVRQPRPAGALRYSSRPSALRRWLPPPFGAPGSRRSA
ncbi:hypothetical protein D9M68_604450 [compost metagenome]